MFAPTYNPGLGAAFLIIDDDPVTAIRGADESIRVVLAPHPHLRRTAAALMAAWRTLAATRPNGAFFDSAVGNLITSLADADLVVSAVLRPARLRTRATHPDPRPRPQPRALPLHAAPTQA